MKHKARTSPESLRSAAQRLSICVLDLNNHQLMLKNSVTTLQESWVDAQSKRTFEKIELLADLVDRQIRDNEEVCIKLRRKADRLSEYLNHQIR
jgi:hypothetical protein